MSPAAAVFGSVGLLVAAPSAEEISPHTNPVCWKEPRIYFPGGARAAEFERVARRAVHLLRVTSTLEPPFTISPNGAYAFRVSERANPGPPSGSTTVSLLVFKEKAYLLDIRADDVSSLHEPRWVNEKLISFRLWLSRLGGVDFLVDVEEESIVRTEAFADGGIL